MNMKIQQNIYNKSIKCIQKITDIDMSNYMHAVDWGWCVSHSHVVTNNLLGVSGLGASFTDLDFMVCAILRHHDERWAVLTERANGFVFRGVVFQLELTVAGDTVEVRGALKDRTQKRESTQQLDTAG